MGIENRPANETPFGLTIEQLMLDKLPLAPIERFSNLRDLKNLKGDSTGYVQTLTCEGIDRACSLSIEIAPGMRYFNIHIMPEARFDVPRFSFEGMIAPHGSQVSMDLYPDYDVITHFDHFEAQFAGVAKAFDAAKNEAQLPLEFSRIPHMRAIASPYFVLVPRATEEQLPKLLATGEAYFAEWLKLFEAREALPDDEAAERLTLRNLIGRIIIERDPDRDMVVQVYGEETTQAIEAAAMP